MKKVAIMQPTFMPWIGYFAMINEVDEFVFLNHVQFEKRSWQHRNKIKTINGESWITIPVLSKGKQNQSIQQTEIAYDGLERSLLKISKTIHQSYSKAPFYKYYIEELDSIMFKGYRYISDLNQELIRFFSNKIGINTEIKISSDMMLSQHKAELLAEICTLLNADEYLSAPGSKVYIDKSDAFSRARVNLKYFNYVHPEYKQLHKGFLPYMSILDLLFNTGKDSKSIIESGVSR